MTRRLTSLDLLMLDHADALERMRRCLHRRGYRVDNKEIASAWRDYSTVAKGGKGHAATPAWAPSPTDDRALLVQLERALGLRTRWHYYLVYFSCYLLIGLLFAELSQYLIYDEAFKRLSSRLTSPAIGSLFYPAAEAPDNRLKTTVFTLDDGDLKNYKETYPVPYGFHAKRLAALGSMSPKAIFIDIWFKDERNDPSIKQLVDEICRLHKDGTRVYLAVLTDKKTGELLLRPELKKITAAADAKPASANDQAICAIGVGVDKDVDAVDRQTWQYGIANSAGHQLIYSAAAQIYNDFSGQPPLPLSAPALAMIWGVHGADINRKPYRANPDYEPTCRNSWYAVEAIPMPMRLRHLIFGEELAKPFCPYHVTLPTYALTSEEGEGIPVEVLQPQFVENRIIVYGSNVQSVDDVLYSPVHGRLPGVQMHAMALDNLFHFGSRYPRAEDFDFQKPGAPATFFAVSAITVFSLLATWMQWCRSTRPDNRARMHAWPRRLRLSIAASWRSCPAGRSQWRASLAPPRTASDPHCRLPARMVRIFWRVMNALRSAGLAAVLSIVWKWSVRITITVLMLFLMAWVGLKLFHLGPLSWMEYAISPIAMEFLHLGEKFARYLHPKVVAGFKSTGQFFNFY